MYILLVDQYLIKVIDILLVIGIGLIIVPVIHILMFLVQIIII